MFYHLVDNSIIFSGKITCNVKICREFVLNIKTSGTHIFPMFARWARVQGSFLLTWHGYGGKAETSGNGYERDR